MESSTFYYFSSINYPFCSNVFISMTYISVTYFCVLINTEFLWSQGGWGALWLRTVVEVLSPACWGMKKALLSSQPWSCCMYLSGPSRAAALASDQELFIKVPTQELWKGLSQIAHVFAYTRARTHTHTSPDQPQLWPGDVPGRGPGSPWVVENGFLLPHHVSVTRNPSSPLCWSCPQLQYFPASNSTPWFPETPCQIWEEMFFPLRKYSY